MQQQSNNTEITPDGYKHICLHCGKTFISSRPEAKYCSAKCRQKAFHMRAVRSEQEQRIADAKAEAQRRESEADQSFKEAIENARREGREEQRKKEFNTVYAYLLSDILSIGTSKPVPPSIGGLFGISQNEWECGSKLSDARRSASKVDQLRHEKEEDYKRWRAEEERKQEEAKREEERKQEEAKREEERREREREREERRAERAQELAIENAKNEAMMKTLNGVFSSSMPLGKQLLIGGALALFSSMGKK